MDRREAVTGDAHEQMVFGVIIDPIGRDRRAGEPAGAGRARVGEGVVAAGRGAGVLGDVADAQELAPDKVGAVSGLFFGFAFGMGGIAAAVLGKFARSEEHTSELQSLMRISYAVFCLKKKI